MKQLTIEEKAKAYDNALKVLHKYDGAHIMFTQDLKEEMFPELKESKNNKIIRVIRGWIYSRPDFFFDNGISKEEFIDWLEKQVNQDNVEDVDILHRFSFYSYKDEPNVLYLSGFYVNEKYRNKGIGTKILEVADEVAKSLDCYAIRLKTKKDSDAERLYRTHGYNSLVTEDKDEIWLEKQGKSIKIKKGKNYFCIKTHNYAGVKWIKGTKYYASDNYNLVNQGCECYCPEYSKEEHNNLFEEVKFDDCVEKQGKSIDIPVDAVLNSNEDGLIAETIRYKKEQQGEQNTHLPSFDEAQGTPMVEQCEQKFIKEHNVCDFCEDTYGCINPCPVKLIEQKPVDKVGPKFKVGDWITDNNSTFQIVRVENEWYYADDGDKICFDVAHQYYYLWTIQDAKDGDILITKGKQPFIFKNYDEGTDYVYAYCGICDLVKDDSFYADDDQLWTCYSDNGDVYPATKEQCNLLFKKMNEAGFEWDSEKKELKKIIDKKQIRKNLQDNSFRRMFEQKSTYNIKPKFNIGDTIAKKHNSDIHDFGSFTITDITGDKYWYNDRIICDITEQDDWEIYEPIRQKSAWSEEDEEIHRKCICAMRASACGFPEEEKFVEQVNNWLKSLKDRVQSKPKSEWNVEDERIIVKLHNALEAQNYYDGVSGKYIVPHKEEINWLKSLKDRIQLHNLTVTDKELSQAKKEAYNDALNKIEYHSGEPTFDDGWSAAIWYFKKRNGKLQSQWKPSDEQMKALENAMSMGAKLDLLYNDLKKLKEE